MDMREELEDILVDLYDYEKTINSAADEIEKIFKEGLSHIGDGSKAEPVGHFYNDPKNGRVGVEWCCDHLDSGTALFVCPAPTAQGGRVPESWKLIPIEPTTDALYALAEVDGYVRGDRDMPGLTRWEDYYRAIYAALSAQYVAEKPDHTEQPLEMVADTQNPFKDCELECGSSGGSYCLCHDEAAQAKRIAMVADKPQLSLEDLQIIRQWYNCVSDLNPKYLNVDGFDDAAVFRKVYALIDDGLQRPQPPEKQ